MTSWQDERVGEPDAVERHRRALWGFTAVVETVGHGGWERPTPCTDWDARALVEHVIGFHEFLLLGPVGVRAHRPRVDPRRRWLATDTAIRAVLADPAALDTPAGYFDDAVRRPREVLSALATDTLVHTWDLARAVGAADRLDDESCEAAYAEARRRAGPRDASAMFAAEVAVPAEAPVQDRLLGLLGRDPRWRPAGQ